MIRRNVALRRTGVALALVAAFLPARQKLAASQTVEVLGPERFMRAAGPPTTIVRTFDVAPPISGPFTLIVDSGESDPARPGLTNVGRGTVRLNGIEVVGPADFARQSHLERSVILLSRNVMEITLVGAPGSHLTVAITGVVNVSISAITPDNGPVGTSVLITGSGFDAIAANDQVSFNGVAAQVLNATPAAIQTVVPAGATTGPITVTTPHGSAVSGPFTVTAANQLLLSKSPDQSVYSRGQPITINALLVDGNGQPVPNAVVTLASTPAEDSRTGNTFIYDTDGTYTITAVGEGGGQPAVTASLTLTVRGAGATITCAPPFDGGMINSSPGSLLSFAGSVSSVNGVSQFTVDGTDVPVGSDGTFTTTIPAAWGLNAVDLALVDNSGLETRQLCSFLASDRWVAEGDVDDNSIMFRNAQGAIDDGSRAGSINSFADVVYILINSPSVHSALDSALLAANPLKPSSCDVSFLFGCLQDSQVVYISSTLPGPNTVSLTSVNGGIAADVVFNNPQAHLEVSGQVAGIPYDVSGDVNYGFVHVHVTFDTGLVNGRPHITIRPGSVSVTDGTISLNFSGLDGAVFDIVNTVAQGTLRTIVNNQLQNFVTTTVTNVLDGVVSSLDVVTLPTSFDVPPLQSGTPLTLSFGLRFSSLSTTSSRILFGIGTRFAAAAAQSRPSLGTPLASDPLVDAPAAFPQTITEAFHESLIGNALHAMWRGGYFDTILTEGALAGAVPSGVSLVTTATLPPVTRIRADGRTEIAVGGMNVSLQDPVLFAGQLQGRLAGRVSCNSQLSGDAIVFDACTVDEFHFVGDRPLDATTAAQVDALLTGVLKAMLFSAGTSALPVLPIPAFTLPASVAPYGLPAGAIFGLVGPSLTVVPPHNVVSGQMGIR